MIDRAWIVSEARSWIGTPYRDQHSTKHRGTDCLGLVRGVWREVLGEEPETPPPYSPSWAEVGDEEPMLNAADRHMTRVDEPQPGDVLVFRMKRGAVAKHCAVMTSPNSMVHAHQGSGKVEETTITPYWERRLVVAFRFPGV